jgi:hypothetical protein
MRCQQCLLQLKKRHTDNSKGVNAMALRLLTSNVPAMLKNQHGFDCVTLIGREHMLLVTYNNRKIYKC